jgi:hypothetical protein
MLVGNPWTRFKVHCQISLSENLRINRLHVRVWMKRWKHGAAISVCAVKKVNSLPETFGSVEALSGESSDDPVLGYRKATASLRSTITVKDGGVTPRPDRASSIGRSSSGRRNREDTTT